MAKGRSLRIGICGALLSATEALSSGALQAQRVAPAGVRHKTEAARVETINPVLRFAVRQWTSDSSGAARMEHAVVGAAVGAAVGVAVGYYRGRSADAQCTGDCGGPAIATLVYPPLYGLVCAGVGAIVGYLLP